MVYLQLMKIICYLLVYNSRSLEMTTQRKHPKPKVSFHVLPDTPQCSPWEQMWFEDTEPGWELGKKLFSLALSLYKKNLFLKKNCMREYQITPCIFRINHSTVENEMYKVEKHRQPNLPWGSFLPKKSCMHENGRFLENCHLLPPLPWQE